MKNPISDGPLKLLGFTLDDYLLWCKCHNFNSKLRETKTNFFKLIYERVIIKKHNAIYEDGVKLE